MFQLILEVLGKIPPLAPLFAAFDVVDTIWETLLQGLNSMPCEDYVALARDAKDEQLEREVRTTASYSLS